MFWSLTFYFLLMWLVEATTKDECTTNCHEGQYCKFDECLACPYGYYQDFKNHTQVSCIEWTTKSLSSFYVLYKNGSSISDSVYKCKDGYEEIQYTTDSWECRKINPTTATTIGTSTTETNRPLISSTTTTVAAIDKGHDSGSVNLAEDVLSIVIPGVVVVGAAIIGCVIFYFWKQRRNLEEENNNSTTIPLIISQNQFQYLNYDFFHKIVDDLKVDGITEFLKVIVDPSKKFNLEELVKSKQYENAEPHIYLTHVCLAWVEYNSENGNLQMFIDNALRDIGHPNLLKCLVESEGANGNCQTNDITTVGVQFNGKGKRCRYLLSEFLATNLLVENAELLLYQLTPSEFDVRIFFDRQKDKCEDFQLCFSNTFMEWSKTKPAVVVRDCVTNVLKIRGLNEILDHKDFQSLLNNIV